MSALKITSLLAQSADPVVLRLAGYLAHRLRLPVEFADVQPWPERERLLDCGAVQIGWICGYPYTIKVDREALPFDLLVAPVMAHPRYGGCPIYFSDVVVHRESPFHTFADLRGASWAYNEVRSHSGYNVVRYHLVQLGAQNGYFGRVVQSGAHQRSLQMVLDRQVDAAAIDSIVLETERRQRPDLARQIRIVAALGPSPSPPWVVHKGVDADLRDTIRAVFLNMHREQAGQAVLAAAQMSHFAAVEDRAYDPIREMARRTQGVALPLSDAPTDGLGPFHG